MMQLAHLNNLQKTISQQPGDKTEDLLPYALISLGFVSIIFAALPELDLITSRFFWDAANGFEFESNYALIALRDANRFMPWLVIGTAAAVLTAIMVTEQARRLASPHKLLFVITFFAVGPGLCVQGIKALVGRARPKVLEEFGGSAIFTPPWDISDQCMRNCSFISGEAASAFALLTLVIFIKPRYAKFYLSIVGLMAACISLNRVAFGAHFLSDVVIAWNVMWVVAVLLWRVFSRHAGMIDAVFYRR
ncbi:phosphatase PAP2 family protein [Ciceribacter sp. L1K22]|uniref:phosphatase PAP2 family protein n=1 Tax=Ciceribacter sp. L1K22 TaxID=2820275 RepID=UPI001ABE655F|nr:phosphatase PAP2 family protein [Ciceribacter sp. L1K22]MBO3758327.1 phosphatase PAP2 family protein [Ciceribacter sp. L1K22]